MWNKASFVFFIFGLSFLSECKPLEASVCAAMAKRIEEATAASGVKSTNRSPVRHQPVFITQLPPSVDEFMQLYRKAIEGLVYGGTNNKGPISGIVEINSAKSALTVLSRMQAERKIFSTQGEFDRTIQFSINNRRIPGLYLEDLAYWYDRFPVDTQREIWARANMILRDIIDTGIQSER